LTGGNKGGEAWASSGAVDLKQVAGLAGPEERKGPEKLTIGKTRMGEKPHKKRGDIKKRWTAQHHWEGIRVRWGWVF